MYCSILNDSTNVFLDNDVGYIKTLKNVTPDISGCYLTLNFLMQVKELCHHVLSCQIQDILLVGHVEKG